MRRLLRQVEIELTRRRKMIVMAVYVPTLMLLLIGYSTLFVKVSLMQVMISTHPTPPPPPPSLHFTHNEKRDQILALRASLIVIVCVWFHPGLFLQSKYQSSCVFFFFQINGLIRLVVYQAEPDTQIPSLSCTLRTIWKSLQRLNYPTTALPFCFAFQCPRHVWKVLVQLLFTFCYPTSNNLLSLAVFVMNLI